MHAVLLVLVLGAQAAPPTPAVNPVPGAESAAETAPDPAPLSAPAEPASITTNTPASTGAESAETAPASTGEPTADKARPLLSTAVTGYLDSRTAWGHAVTDPLLPGTDVPAWTNLSEFNFQLKLRWGERAFALVDAGFFWQHAWQFPGPAHDVAAYRPLAIVSEAYASYNVSDHLNVTIGKKRVVWGPGQVINPSDVLNPPKDPTDPTFQRAGAWLARVEAPFERFTVSAVAAAQALRTYGGVPTSLVRYPDYPAAGATTMGAADDRDDRAHYALVARIYALVADTDLGAYYAFTNRYGDDFDHRSRVGLSVSRLVGKSLEIHSEAIAQTGTHRLFKNRPANLGIDDLVIKAIAGPRYTFDDDSMLGVEYYFSGDGYTLAEFQTALAAVDLALQKGLRPGQGGSATDPGAPQKFTFDPQRRHYLFVSYTKPRIRDDFTLQATVLMNAQDLTGRIAPSVMWNAREWLNLTLALFAPLPGLASNKVEIRGRRWGEFSLAPQDWRVLVSARAFY